MSVFPRALRAAAGQGDPPGHDGGHGKIRPAPWRVSALADFSAVVVGKLRGARSRSRFFESGGFANPKRFEIPALPYLLAE